MANQTDTTVVAAFRSSADAQAAAADLQAAGIDRADIFLEGGSATGTAAETTNSYTSRANHHEGGVAGWFKSLFGDNEPENVQGGYQRALDEGGYLLSVDTASASLDSVETILNRHSPVNIHSDATSTYGSSTDLPYNERAASYEASTAATPGTATTAGVAGTGAAAGTGKIAVVQEDLNVGKRSVLRGGVRVFSRLVETPVEENIALREEHVRVNRQPVDRPATDADFAAAQNRSFEVEEYGEEAVVAKKARVVEEIEVDKNVTERTETVRDSVRHTEVDVEQVPGTTERTQAKTTGR